MARWSEGDPASRGKSPDQGEFLPRAQINAEKFLNFVNHALGHGIASRFRRKPEIYALIDNSARQSRDEIAVRVNFSCQLSETSYIRGVFDILTDGSKVYGSHRSYPDGRHQISGSDTKYASFVFDFKNNGTPLKGHDYDTKRRELSVMIGKLTDKPLSILDKFRRL